MEGIILGQYVPGESLLHRLDPRTKVIISAVLVWAVFLLKTPVEYGVYGALLLSVYFFAGVLGSFIRVIKPGIYIIIFTLILHSVLTPGRPVLNLGLFFLTYEGIVSGITIGLRLAFLIAVSSLVTLTTSPVRLTDGLEKLMNPMKRIGLPTSELAMMANIALRFIPTFWEETEKIKKAQVSRGADFESWHPVRRIKYLTALLVPLFVSAFRRADELAMAMESRGYVVGMKRTSLRQLEMNWLDYIVIVLVVLCALAFAYYRYFL